MKLNLSKPWIEWAAETEDGCDVGVNSIQRGHAMRKTAAVIGQQNRLLRKAWQCWNYVDHDNSRRSNYWRRQWLKWLTKFDKQKHT